VESEQVSWGRAGFILYYEKRAETIRKYGVDIYVMLSLNSSININFRLFPCLGGSDWDGV
jgi:hypothetical protein